MLATAEVRWRQWRQYQSPAASSTSFRASGNDHSRVTHEQALVVAHHIPSCWDASMAWLLEAPTSAIAQKKHRGSLWASIDLWLFPRPITRADGAFRLKAKMCLASGLRH